MMKEREKERKKEELTKSLLSGFGSLSGLASCKFSSEAIYARDSMSRDPLLPFQIFKYRIPLHTYSILLYSPSIATLLLRS